jgi:hypothetical protein
MWHVHACGLPRACARVSVSAGCNANTIQIVYTDTVKECLVLGASSSVFAGGDSVVAAGASALLTAAVVDLLRLELCGLGGYCGWSSLV